MLKNEFLDILKRGISSLPEAESEETLRYYSEMIDDRIEDGMSEEEAVAAVGSVGSIIENALRDKSASVESNPKTKKKIPVWAIVLIIIGAPIWLGIACGLLGGAFGIVVGVASVILALYASSLACFVSFFGCIISSVAGLVNGTSVSVALLTSGAGFIALGVSVLLFLGGHYSLKGIIKLIKFIISKTRKGKA